MSSTKPPSGPVNQQAVDIAKTAYIVARRRIGDILSRQFQAAVSARLDVASAIALSETLEAATTEACEALKEVRPPGGWRGVKIFGVDVENYEEEVGLRRRE